MRSGHDHHLNRRGHTPTLGDRRRPAYTRLAALGLVLAAAAPLVLLVGGLLGGLPFDGDSFFFIVAGLALVGAFLVSRFGTWARIVALVVSLLVGAAAFWMAFGLAVPGSFVDFVPGVLLPLGVLLGVGGSIAALVANRRGQTRARSGAGERRLATAALASSPANRSTRRPPRARPRRPWRSSPSPRVATRSLLASLPGSWSTTPTR